MRRAIRTAAALAGLGFWAGPAPMAAQEFLLRLDSRVQSASWRGLTPDSILSSDVVTGPDGSLRTPDGYAVGCLPGATFCQYFRPGPLLRGGPFTTTADLSVWGLGIRGVSLHGSARLGADLGDSEIWPGRRPAVQLLEGYAEYADPRLTGRVGRLVERSRLDYTGYDGARVAWRLPSLGVTGIAYGGFGLARATALPVTSDILNPLDEFRPRMRQLVAGAALEWEGAAGNARVDYLREVDRDTRNFVSERAALSATLRPLPGWSLTGGTEYDLAYGWWGTSDLSLRHAGHWGGAMVGVRRYRPYFDLWTLWGVFSPVPYNAVNGALWVAPLHGLELRAGGERYRYDNAAAETPLVSLEDRGWRWNAGASYAPSEAIAVDGGYHVEFGPGAASRGGDGSLTWRPVPALSLTAEGGRLVRPLELRFSDAELTWYGLSADLRAGDRLRLGIGATRYDEERQRPDAGAFDWSQTRFRARVTWLFGSSADQLPLPPARRPGAGR